VSFAVAVRIAVVLAVAAAALAACPAGAPAAEAGALPAAGEPTLQAALPAAEAAAVEPAADGPIVSASANCAGGAAPSECPWYDTPTIFVHGYDPEIPFKPTNCETYWHTAREHLNQLAQDATGHSLPETIEVGYYKLDEGCNIVNSKGTQTTPNLSNYAPLGCCLSAQSNNTSIAVLGYELRKFIYTRFGNRPVNIVAHSMGGLVTRTSLSVSSYPEKECLTFEENIYCTEIGNDIGEIPQINLGHVVTLGTPHEGVGPFICNLNDGLEDDPQMCEGSGFLQWLGQQTTQGLHGTSWMAIAVGATKGPDGLEGDGVVPERSAALREPGKAGYFNPEVRIDYAQGENYNHLNENTGTDGKTPSDGSCEQNGTSESACFIARLSLGTPTEWVEGAHFPGIREMTMYGLEGQLAPSVSAVTPSLGATTGGTPVVINGTNLATVEAVYFGSTPATGVRVLTPNTVEAVSPAHAAGTVDVRVSTPFGTTATGSADHFVYYTPPPPPTSGTVFVGLHDLYAGYEGPSSEPTGATAWHYTTCTNGWIGNTTVMESGAWVNKTDSSEAWTTGVGTTTSTMWWTAGTGVLKENVNYAVYADIDTCNAASANAWYTIAGNDGVVGFGSGDTQQKNVDVNQANSSGYVWLGTVNSGPAGVTVALVNGGASGSVGAADMKLVPVSPPSVTSISPTSGSTNGGTSVTISGSNLGGALSVYFGSVKGTIASDSSGAVVATAPAAAAGTVDVIVNTVGGASAKTSADHFTYVAPPAGPPPGSVYVGLSDRYGASGGPETALTGEAGLWHKTTCSASGWKGATENLEGGFFVPAFSGSEWWVAGKANPSTTTIWWTAGSGVLLRNSEYVVYADVDSCNASTSAAWYTIAGNDGTATFSGASEVHTEKVDQETATGYVPLGVVNSGERDGITVALVNGGANHDIGAADIRLERIKPCIKAPCPS
jgi:hypothetical protein